MDCMYHNYAGDCIVKSLFLKITIKCNKLMECEMREPLPIKATTDEDLLRHEKKMIQEIANILDCKNCYSVSNKERAFIHGIKNKKITSLSSRQLEWVRDIYEKI